MPEISLKAYFTKLNALLSANAADEVIHHCRHILHYFPKNVITYRLMGRALVNNGRWEEGSEILRRVLGVIPDDYAAHLGLSEANERMDRPDAAIWHLERAFEQRPNDKELIDALRGLYRRHRKIDNLKIQLTAATVARQYMRSGSYAQAVDTLRNALTRLIDRPDLKLLLAQILWQQGSEEEAAEIALEVLKVLPDCLEANRIEAALWLSFDRPSDAQRYVNRLESVDPYSAVELVQGFPPDDDAFRIEELDYSRSAQREMTSARPDWLQEISIEATATSGENTGSEQGDEWSNWASAMLSSQTPEAENAVETKGESRSEAPADSGHSQQPSMRYTPPARQEPASQESIISSGLTDLFGNPDDTKTGELAALFENDDDDGDSMAWLRSSGIEVDEDEEAPDYDTLLGVNEPMTMPEANEDPMAWMGDSSDALLFEVEADEDEDDEDPFAWMREADAEADEDEFVASDMTQTPDAESLFGETRAVDSVEDALDQAAEQSDAWELPDFDAIADDDSIDAPVSATEPETELRHNEGNLGVPGARRGLTAILQDANLDWMQSSQEEIVSDDEMDDWLNQFGGAPTPAPKATDVPDWLDAINTREDDEAVVEDEADEYDWLAQTGGDEPAPVGTFEPDASALDGAWLNNELNSDQALDEEDGEDWLAEFAPESASSNDDFEWMSDEALTTPKADADVEFSDEQLDAFTEQLMASADAEDEATEPADAGTAAGQEIPDWVSGLEPEASEPEKVTEKIMGDNEFDWLNEPDSEADDQGEIAGEVPDWLSELSPESDAEDEAQAAAPVDPEATTLDGEFGWLNDAGETMAGEIPDWMSELAPTDEGASHVEQSTEADTELEWAGDLSLAGDEEAEAVAADVPDWLNELEPEQDEAAESAEEPAAQAEESTLDDDFSWLADDDVEEEGEAVAVEVPDWMSELAPQDAVTEPQVPAEAISADVDDPELEWMGELATEDEEEAEAVAAEVPDWLSELEPTETEPQIPAEAVSAEADDAELEWMSELTTEDEEEAEAVVADAPDWLSELEPTELQPEAEPQIPAEAVSAEADDAELEWMSELTTEDEEEAEAVAADAPDWLNELEPTETEPESEAEDEAAFTPVTEDEAELEETYGWLNEADESAEAEIEAEADETPDWLTEAGETAAELAVEEDDDFEWLNDGVAEAELYDEEVEAEAVGFDADDEFDDNQSEVAAELGDDGEELEPAPAQNAPDWLNAMVPGLDVEYDIADDGGDDDAVEEEADGEIAWLVDMVEEETAAVEHASFAFSSPPAWLSSASHSITSSADDDDFPDWPADDVDDDTPEWLR